MGILFHSSILSQILINFPIRSCQTHASCSALILCPLDFLAFVTQEHQSTNLEFVWPSDDPSLYSSSSISRRKTKGTSSGIVLILPHSKPAKYSSRPALITHHFVIKRELGSSQFVVVIVLLVFFFFLSQFLFLQEAVTS